MSGRMREALPSGEIDRFTGPRAAAPDRAVAAEPTTTIAELTARVAGLENVIRLARGEETDEPVPGRREFMKDAAWKCGKCNSLLAYYDHDTDVIRIRYKDHLVRAQIGPGGWVEVLCRGCGENNRKEYLTPEQVAAEKAATRGQRRERSA